MSQPYCPAEWGFLTQRANAHGGVRDALDARDQLLAPAGVPQRAPRLAQRRLGVRGADRQEVDAGLLEDLEPGAAHHAPEAGRVGLPPPRLVQALEARRRGTGA